MTNLPYSEHLVHIESEDHNVLDGAVIRPAAGTVKPLPVVWTHGMTGRFHEVHNLAIGRTLAANGYVFVVGNNRGNHYGAFLDAAGSDPTVLGPTKLGGAGWELIDESPLDISAWISHAVGLGFEQVILAGHSLGGTKVANYMNVRQDPRVRGLILASGGFWSGSPTPPEVLKQAEQMVADGRGEEMLPWGSAASRVRLLSAQTFASRRRLNTDPAGIRCPILAILGTEEPFIGDETVLDAFRQRATSAPRVDTRMIAGANHTYVGKGEEVGRVVARWADTLL